MASCVPLPAVLDDLPARRRAHSRLRDQHTCHSHGRGILLRLRCRCTHPRQASFSCTRWRSSQATGWRCWSIGTWELQAESGAVPGAVFGTTIHDETLFKVRPFNIFVKWFSSLFPLLFPSLPPTVRVVKHLHAIIPSAACRLQVANGVRPSLWRQWGDPA